MSQWAPNERAWPTHFKQNSPVTSEEMDGTLKIDHEQKGKTHFDTFKKFRQFSTML